MVNINAEKADPGTVHCFNGNAGLFTAVRILQLADRLGLKVEERAGGTYWVAFTKAGNPIANVSFFDPAHAYAFLLGYAAAC